MIIYVSFHRAICNNILFYLFQGQSIFKCVCVSKFTSPTGVLKIITDMFLPHIGLSELEDECFSKILPKVNSMMRPEEWIH